MINTRVKWIYGVSGLEGNDLEFKINKELEELEKQYGDIIVDHIEIVSNGFGKDAFIVYNYEQYDTINGEAEKLCSCNKNSCNKNSYDDNKLTDKLKDRLKEYKSNITILDNYYDGSDSYHYIKIVDNNKLISKTKKIKGSSSESTSEMINKYARNQLKEEI